MAADTLQVNNIQKEALRQIASLPAPGVPDEAWRRVPLEPISALLRKQNVASQIKSGRVDIYANNTLLSPLDISATEVSSVVQRWGDLEALRQENRLERPNDIEQNQLFAYPLAYAQSIYHLQIAAEDSSETIQIDIRLSSDETAGVATPIYYFPVLLIHAEKNSSASIQIKLHLGQENQTAVMLSRTVLILEDGASVDYMDAVAATNTTAGVNSQSLAAGYQLEQAYLGRDAKLRIGREIGSFETGMHDGRYALQGRGARLEEYTLMQSGDTDSSDRSFCGQKSVVEQYAPHTMSNVETRSILDAAAHGMFVGTIKIPTGAPGSTGHEQHRSLLLSPQSRIESLPELEIVENEASCSHGSTVTELDPESRYYLESRGISREDTRVLLTAAFTDQLRSRMPGAQFELDELEYVEKESSSE
ncbi:MAG: SufD family Fe-S cluster assembly protein [Spirochaetaceae bacterium]|nr:SufD family Fe-S cluster assembly protein [Spirochaetaceae bacterium]MCF7949363.1 SufD family Fe-S cluster assembly protein [Spirochaetia bacterium]MCF7951472.1 SufD family Fe-S cluster assembly protein [Spirochaetaceae bacterium]